MLAVLAVKHFALRRLALMGKVVILDEVHSYDHYSRTIIQKLCRELADLGATVIILSATLTASARTALLQTDCTVTSMDPEEDSLPYPCISGHAHGQDAMRTAAYAHCSCGFSATAECDQHGYRYCRVRRAGACVPHMRGNDPDSTALLLRMLECSPHAWG